MRRGAASNPRTSQRLSSLGPNPNPLSFVIKLPNSLPQYDEAGIQVYLNSPTVQLYNSWVAYDRFEVNLGGSTVQATYALTTEQRTKLASAPYDDLQIRIEFHSPQSGTYVFDGFAGLPLPDPSKGECGLSPSELEARDSGLLRFEKPQDWTAQTRVVVPATLVAEGTHALAVSGYGYSRITSRRACYWCPFQRHSRSCWAKAPTANCRACPGGIPTDLKPYAR